MSERLSKRISVEIAWFSTHALTIMIRFILVQVPSKFPTISRSLFAEQARKDKIIKVVCSLWRWREGELGSSLGNASAYIFQVRIKQEVHRVVAPRDQKSQSNFVEVNIHTLIAFQSSHLNKFRNYKIIYRRYAGLYFCICVDANDNELAYLEAIHFFVEVLGQHLLRSFRNPTDTA